MFLTKASFVFTVVGGTPNFAEKHGQDMGKETHQLYSREWGYLTRSKPSLSGLLLTRPLRVFTPSDACCSAFRRLDWAFGRGFRLALVLAMIGGLAFCACEFFAGLVILWGRKGRRGVLSLLRREDLSSTSANRKLLQDPSKLAATLLATCAAFDSLCHKLFCFRGDAGCLNTGVRTGPRDE